MASSFALPVTYPTTRYARAGVVAAGGPDAHAAVRRSTMRMRDVRRAMNGRSRESRRSCHEGVYCSGTSNPTPARIIHGHEHVSEIAGNARRCGGDRPGADGV